MPEVRQKLRDESGAARPGRLFGNGGTAPDVGGAESGGLPLQGMGQGSYFREIAGQEAFFHAGEFLGGGAGENGKELDKAGFEAVCDKLLLMVPGVERSVAAGGSRVGSSGHRVASCVVAVWIPELSITGFPSSGLRPPSHLEQGEGERGFPCRIYRKSWQRLKRKYPYAG